MYRIALAALLLTACSDGVGPDAAPAPATSGPTTTAAAPPTTPPAATTPPATTAPPDSDGTVYPPALLRGDVDGDGRPDAIRIVESSRRRSAEWRYGVRVAMTSAGRRTAWSEPGFGAGDGQAMLGVTDVDGDGLGEIAVLEGTTVSAGYYRLVTFAGGRLRFVHADVELVAGVADYGRLNYGWGCRGGLVYTAAPHEVRASGTLTWYRLVGARLVRVRTETRRWRAGTTPPPPFAEPLIRCGSFG